MVITDGAQVLDNELSEFCILLLFPVRNPRLRGHCHETSSIPHMQKITILLACTFALATAAPLYAAEGDKPAAAAAAVAGDKPAAVAGEKRVRGARGAKGERPAKTLRDLDKNANRQIDGDEVDALKKQFAAEPKSALARFDKNADSKLDDDEVKALNEVMAKRGQRKAAGGKAAGRKAAGGKRKENL